MKYQSENYRFFPIITTKSALLYLNPLVLTSRVKCIKHVQCVVTIVTLHKACVASKHLSVWAKTLRKGGNEPCY